MEKYKRGEIKAFKEYLNKISEGLPNWKNGRYYQSKRSYGDYLYAQDKIKFFVDLDEYIKNK